MKTYEYYRMTQNPRSDVGITSGDLIFMGSAGWELVAAHYVGIALAEVIFRREPKAAKPSRAKQAKASRKSRRS